MTDQHPLSPSPGSPDWDALARYLAGESSADEAAQIDRFLAANSQDRAVLDGLKGLIERGAPVEMSAAEIEQALNEVRRRRGASTTVRLEHGRGPVLSGFRSRAPWMSMAAALTVLVAGAFLWTRVSDGSGSAPSGTVAKTYRTGLGSADSIRLADGSRVVLAPQSELIVSAEYGAARREVELRGVAYFDVVHDDARPFEVRSGEATIRDVGTIFTVRSDSNGALRVAVQEGAVLVQRVGVPADPGVLLHQGDLATMQPGEPLLARRGAVGADEAAWTAGRLVFKGAPLTEVASELRRWYGVELRAADSAIAGRHLTAEFRGEPLDQIVRELTLALDAGVERRGDTLVVRSTGGQR
jgi:transmembrane sensor